METYSWQLNYLNVCEYTLNSHLRIVMIDDIAYLPSEIFLLLFFLLLCIADATIALKSEFLREIALMKKVSGGVCSYVVNMVGCCTHQEPIALVLEYAANGDLLQYLRSMRKLVCVKPIHDKCKLHVGMCIEFTPLYSICSAMTQNR